MADPIIVRDQCVCGKRFRIRHARAGFQFDCPKCGRTITLTDADIELGEPDMSVTDRFEAPAATEQLLEAIPLGDDLVRLAPHGAQRGATGRVEYDSSEAAMFGAMAGRPLIGDGSDLVERPLTFLTARSAKIAKPRNFTDDLLASFVFAGLPGNAIKLGATAAGCAVVWAFGQLWAMALGNFPGVFIMGMLLFGVVAVAVAAYVLQLFWQILEETAGGEDELAWVTSDWDLWGDVIVPVWWLLMITLFCGVPAVVVEVWYADTLPAKPLVLIAAGVLGSLLWPVAVMSVAIGRSLLFIRPDWLVRCIAGIGPRYLLAWLVVVAMFGALTAFFSFNISLASLGPLGTLMYLTLYPLVAFAVHICCGYVAFRTMGLLYRHSSKRFPWDL